MDQENNYNSNSTNHEKVSVISDITPPMQLDSNAIYQKSSTEDKSFNFGLPTFKEFCEIYEPNEEEDDVSKSLQKIRQMHQLERFQKREIRYFDQYF